MITITDGQTDIILDDITEDAFWNDKHYKSLKENLETFDFTTFADKPFSEHLAKKNRVIIPGEDGEFIEFIIQNTRKYRDTNGVLFMDVYTSASYIELGTVKVIRPQTLQGATAKSAAEFAVAGTEWQVGQVDYAGIRTIPIENHTNPYSLLKQIASEFGLELRFHIEHDGNQITGRYVDLIERVGDWKGREVEFGKDILGIERKEDTSNVVTALVGLGPEREDGTRLEVFVEDKDALARWGRNGQHIIDVYEPQSADTEMTESRLRELTQNELEKRVNSVVEYVGDIADLEKVPGLEHEKIRFGDTIKIKDTGFDPPLYLEARVHTQERSIKKSGRKTVVLGDYIEYTEEEVHAIWKQLQAEIAKKVSMAEVTEVVYTKPEVDERDDAVREHADNVAENAKIEAIQVAAEDASKKAKQAEDSAKEYTDGRLENTVAKDIFENTVTDLLNNIMQKVDSTRFEQVESELRGIAEDLQHEVAEHANTLEEHGGKITKLETDVDEVEGKINATISELEALGDTVSRHETQIDANAREIALKADKQELDLLSGTVSGISSELSVMAGKIEAKAERSEVEKLESDVSKVSQDVSKLTVDVDGIKTNVGSISQTVSNHGTQISNINSTLTQHADMIASKVEKSEFDSVTNSLGNRISTIEQTADSISLEVRDIKANVYTKSEVDSAIDGILVGGRNLIRNSNFGSDDVLDHWDFWGNSISMSVENHYGYNFLKVTSRSNMRGEYYWFRRRPQEFKLVKGVKYTLSWIQVMSEGTEDPRAVIREAGGRGYQQMLSNFQTETILRAEVYGSMRNFVKYSTTFELSDAINESILDIAWRFKNTRDGQEWVMISEPKLEKGNKATDWTPAPEDIDEKFTDIQGTLASHNTKIEQNAQQIQLRATKAEVDTLSGRVNQAESQITQLAGQIELRATKTEVDALSGRVSTVESTIQQHADMIESKIDDGQARSIFRQEASSFTFEASQINFKGHVFGEDATFMGSIGTPMLTIGAEDITGYENFGLRLQTAQWQPDANEPFKKTGYIEFNTLNNGLEIIKYNLDHSTGYLDYFEVYARAFRIWGDIYVAGNGWLYTDAIDFPVGYIPGQNIYIRPANSNGEVRATVTGTTDQYVDMRARRFIAGGGLGNGDFEVEKGYVVLRAGENNYAYIQSDLEVRATKRFDGTSYIPVRASSFPTGSLEEFKTNIKKWEESALDIIRNADIYEFNLKNDLEVGKNKKRYGLVIGDGYRTPEEVIDEDGVEQYAMNSISWKAIQELDTEQQELKGRIAWLESENKLLREKIKKLEGMVS